MEELALLLVKMFGPPVASGVLNLLGVHPDVPADQRAEAVKAAARVDAGEGRADAADANWAATDPRAAERRN
jgi:hypothetical protein